LFLQECEKKGVADAFLDKSVNRKELGEKVDSRQLKVESDRPQTGKKLMSGGESVFDRALIVILQGAFYHTST
jgi:hypothetical protein